MIQILYHDSTDFEHLEQFRRLWATLRRHNKVWAGDMTALTLPKSRNPHGLQRNS